MRRPFCFSGRLAVVLAAAMAAGCAAALPDDGGPLAPVAATQAGSAATRTPASDAGYSLSVDEQKLDCRQLTGRMQVRILQARDALQREQTSGIARMMQGITSPILGGTNYGVDPAEQHRRDRAMLEAYNRQLAAKKCGTFNLEAELGPHPAAAAPQPAAVPQAQLLPADFY